MALLHETQTVLAEMAASQPQSFGTHGAVHPQTGVPGLAVGEVPYDMTRHPVTAINHGSLMANVTRVPYVRLTLPQRPLDVQVVTHHEAGNDDPRLAKLKGYLARQIKYAVEDSVPGMTDRVFSYHIGDDADDFADFDTELLPANGDPAYTAETVADLCHDGLTFVVSDFNRLPLQNVANGWFPATVAVKANHALEMSVPDMAMRLGGTREVRKKKDAEYVNQRLAKYHAGITAGLETAGIPVAQVIMDMNRSDLGQDGLNAADGAIADALRRLDIL